MYSEIHCLIGINTRIRTHPDRLVEIDTPTFHARCRDFVARYTQKDIEWLCDTAPVAIKIVATVDCGDPPAPARLDMGVVSISRYDVLEFFFQYAELDEVLKNEYVIEKIMRATKC